MEDIKKNLETVRGQISEAAQTVGRDGDDVILVAVSKTRTPEEINIAIDAGTTDIGENKVQEIMDKYDDVKPVRWHMIGHLQTNKVKYIIDKVDMIHSVDSIKLAKEIDKRAKAHGKTMDILVQINPAEEESKFGVTIEGAEHHRAGGRLRHLAFLAGDACGRLGRAGQHLHHQHDDPAHPEGPLSKRETARPKPGSSMISA